MQGDLYAQLGKQLRALFKDLHDGLFDAVERDMIKIVKLAEEIGEPVSDEAKQLQRDIAAFIKRPNDEKAGQVLRKHALRLEQETREI